MGHSRYAESMQAMSVARAGRPLGVTLVALFQALKAGTLLLAVVLLRLSPETVLGQQSAFYPILYLALRGKSSLVNAALNGGNALLVVLLLFAAYLAYIASGLWQMRSSARKAVMFTSGMTLVLYVKSTLSSGAGDGSLSGLSFFSPSLHNVHLLLFVDTAIFVYLMRGSTAAKFKAA